jgi:hypothetical protein
MLVSSFFWLGTSFLSQVTYSIWLGTTFSWLVPWLLVILYHLLGMVMLVMQGLLLAVLPLSPSSWQLPLSI